ncbi:unnamed protein product [Schistocephalus solidus]|uniref:Gamma-soluble NSF attachment protein n=1 Tax=Schistocephalus solidus TaxID=70667 RepID=A0A183TE70_SCHSO|nr:unnamed protein product [Schistocephalus solidus]
MYYNSIAWELKSQTAGDAFMQCANIHAEKGESHNAYYVYHNAVTCFLNVDPLMAIEALRKAALLNRGNSTDERIAQIYKRYCNDLNKASEHYELASVNHEGRVTLVLISVQLVKKGLSTMEYYNLRYYMTATVLCKLCFDLAVGKKYLLAYADEYPLFGFTENCNLLKKLVDALEKKDTSAFDSALFAYQSFNVVDWWTEGLLRKLRAALTAN